VTSSPAKSAQLRAGAVGIYEVTFTAPSLPDGTPACSNSVRSNLTIEIGRATSYDGVGICMTPPVEPTSPGRRKPNPRDPAGQPAGQ